MDFALTGEHRMVQQMVKDFAQKEVAPVIKEFDRAQEMAPFILPRMGKLGILGICLPVTLWRSGDGLHLPWLSLRGAGSGGQHPAGGPIGAHRSEQPGIAPVGH